MTRRSSRPAGRATDREVVVVAAVLVAGSEKAAAHRLGQSHSTVKHHLASARSKVGAETTAQLVCVDPGAAVARARGRDAGGRIAAHSRGSGRSRHPALAATRRWRTLASTGSEIGRAACPTARPGFASWRSWVATTRSASQQTALLERVPVRAGLRASPCPRPRKTPGGRPRPSPRSSRPRRGWGRRPSPRPSRRRPAA